MKLETNQMKFWTGDFGKNYTDRNPNTGKQVEEYCINTYGVSRTEMNTEFLINFPKDIRILEVGCNVGAQLQTLQNMGYNNLYGIELQWYAVEKAKTLTKNINIIQGSGFDIPFKDNYFDLVYTSGVLIHINPNDLSVIFNEIARCSNKYIWGFEYFSEEVESINYRGNEGFLWKADYAKLFTNKVNNTKIIKQKKFEYLQDKKLTDNMFLISKK